MGDITLYIKVFITLLMLVNPLEGMPVFLSATSSADPQLRRRILKITSISVVAILLLSIILGKLILQLFGISTEAFQIGGGAILFLIAVKMTLGPSGFSMEDITDFDYSKVGILKTEEIFPRIFEFYCAA